MTVHESLQKIEQAVTFLLPNAEGTAIHNLKVVAREANNIRGAVAFGHCCDAEPSDDTKWLDEHWRDIREYADGVLKLLGSMPIAIHAVENDPEHIQELLIRMSDELTALSNHVGEFRPGTEPCWDKPSEQQAEAVS